MSFINRTFFQCWDNFGNFAYSMKNNKYKFQNLSLFNWCLKLSLSFRLAWLPGTLISSDWLLAYENFLAFLPEFDFNNHYRFNYLKILLILNNTLFIQARLNAGFSLFSIAFLFYYKLYREKHIFISILAGEICALFVFSLAIAFLLELPLFIQSDLENVIIFMVLGTLGIQFMVSVYEFAICKILVPPILWKKGMQWIVSKRVKQL